MGGCDCLQNIYGWVLLFTDFFWLGVGGCDWVGKMVKPRKNCEMFVY